MKKLTETKNELIKKIKDKDEAILELSKFYEVSKNNIIYIESHGKRK